MEQLKHECGVAMIRLLKPLDYYEKKYGSRHWALNKLYLMMEKQHNRGQEGAGIACVDLDARMLLRKSLAEDFLLPNSIWVTCAIRQQERVVYNMYTLSFVVTIGAPRTSVCVVISI